MNIVNKTSRKAADEVMEWNYVVIYLNYFWGNAMASLNTVHNHLDLCYVEFDHFYKIQREYMFNILSSGRPEISMCMYDWQPNKVEWYYRIIVVGEQDNKHLPENPIMTEL